MPKVTVNEARCKGCELCSTACPRQVLALSSRLNAAGYHPMEVKNPDKCIGCAMCYTMCPSVALTVEK